MRMGALFGFQWLPEMKNHGIIPSWGSKYQVTSSTVDQDGSISDLEDDEDQGLDTVDNRSDAGELNVDDILDFD